MNFLQKEETFQGCKQLYYNRDGKPVIVIGTYEVLQKGEEMNGITSNGYSQILERIKRTPVLLPEGDLTVDELYRWLTGYKDAMDTVTSVIEDLMEAERQY